MAFSYVTNSFLENEFKRTCEKIKKLNKKRKYSNLPYLYCIFLKKKIKRKLNIKETVSVYMNVCAFVSDCLLFHY